MKEIYNSLNAIFSTLSYKKDSFNKVNSIRIDNASMHFYPFFIYL